MTIDDNGNIYIFGGLGSSSDLNDFWTITVNDDGSFSEWRQIQAQSLISF